LRRYGYTPWEKNPKICGRCFKGLETQAKMCPSSSEAEEVSGAEVEISILFADVRGSSKLAREMPVWDFTRLMNRFYRVSSDVLIAADAVIEKFVGDEVVGLFIPFLAGQEHAGKAVEAAKTLLLATGHGSADGPWAPLGAGVHTGTAFVGMVGSEGSSDFTALGDPVNVAAHLASQAAVGEILVTNETATAAALAEGLERRHVSLKGHPIEALVLAMQPAAAAGGAGG
jgi:adenylate cyclase